MVIICYKYLAFITLIALWSERDFFVQLGLLIAASIAAYFAHKAWRAQVDPALRLQINNIGVDSAFADQTLLKKLTDNGTIFSNLSSDEKKYLEGKFSLKDITHPTDQKRVRSLLDIYNITTDIQLINDGQGAVDDIQINIEFKDKQVKVKHVTAMGSEGKPTQLAYLEEPKDDKGIINNDGAILNSPDKWGSELKVTLKYRDASRKPGESTFVSNEKYNDGFEKL